MRNEPKFSIDHQLPSCFVSVELLKRIEEFILAEFPQRNDDFSHYHVEITDKVGVQSFTSINDYPHRYLPSQTKAIKFWQTSSIIENGMRMTFELTRLFTSDFQITCAGTDSRERARRIRDDFLRLLEPYETQNQILYSPWVAGLVVVLSLVAYLSLTATVPWLNQKYSLRFLFLSYPAYFIATKLKPYSTFETRENVRRAKVANWIVLAICSALVGIIVKAVVAAF